MAVHSKKRGIPVVVPPEEIREIALEMTMREYIQLILDTKGEGMIRMPVHEEERHADEDDQASTEDDPR